MNPYQFACHALELALILPAAIMVYLPVMRWMRTEPRVTFVITFVICAFVILAGAAICTRFGWPSAWMIVAVLPSICVIYCSLATIKTVKKLFCFFNATMLASFTNMFVGVLSAPLEASNHDVTYLPATSFLCIAILCLIVELFYRALSYKLPVLFAQESLNRTWRLAWLPLLALTVLFSWANPSNGSAMEALASGSDRTAILVLLGIVPLVILFIYEVIWRFASSVIVSSRLRQENNLLSMEEKRYEEMREYMAATRSLRHDFRHHLLVIDELARAGKTDELSEYVGQLSGIVGEGYRHLCANRVIDAVAGRYDVLARNNQISITWSLNLPEKLPFKDTDLCAILGNLVENAIHAVMGLPEEKRVIDVSTRLLSDEMLGITVRNPYEGTVKLDRRGLPRKSTKGEGHGLGLESVASIVHGYHGVLDIKVDDGQFEAGVLLYAA